MADAESEEPKPKKASLKLPLIIGLVLALLGGGGGYMASAGGYLPFGKSGASAHADTGHGGHEAHGSSDGSTPEFVKIEPVIVSLPRSSGHRHLRFAVELEVMPGESGHIAALSPRFVDMMNGYLRAFDVAKFDDPAVLQMIRAHLLARIRVLDGHDRIKGLLITEFVLT